MVDPWRVSRPQKSQMNTSSPVLTCTLHRFLALPHLATQNHPHATSTVLIVTSAACLTIGFSLSIQAIFATPHRFVFHLYSICLPAFSSCSLGLISAALTIALSDGYDISSAAGICCIVIGAVSSLTYACYACHVLRNHSASCSCQSGTTQVRNDIESHPSLQQPHKLSIKTCSIGDGAYEEEKKKPNSHSPSTSLQMSVSFVTPPTSPLDH